MRMNRPWGPLYYGRLIPRAGARGYHEKTRQARDRSRSVCDKIPPGESYRTRCTGYTLFTCQKAKGPVRNDRFLAPGSRIENQITVVVHRLTAFVSRQSVKVLTLDRQGGGVDLLTKRTIYKIGEWIVAILGFI